MRKLKLTALVLMLVMAFSQTAVYAADSEELSELTVSQALTMAVNNNDKIKSLQESEVTYKNTVTTGRDTMLESTTNTAYVSAYKSVTEAQLALSLLETDTKVQKEKLEYNLKSYFAQIIAAENGLVLTDKQLELTKRELDISALRLQLGLISQSTYDSAVYSYESAIISRDNSAATIESYYRNLNELMGQKLDKRYSLELELEYAPIGDSINLTTTIAHAIENSSEIKGLENKVYLAQFDSDTKSYQLIDNNGNFTVSEYNTAKEEAKNAVSLASRNLENAKTNIELNIRSNYDSIKTLERTYEAKVKELAQLQAEMAILDTKLELGQATQLEVDTKALSLEETEETIRSTIYDHAVKKMVLTNPNLASQVTKETAS